MLLALYENRHEIMSQYLSVQRVAVEKLLQILWLRHKMVVMLDMFKCVSMFIAEAANGETKVEY